MIEAHTARLCPAVFCHFQQSKPVPKSKLAAVAEKLNPPLRRHSNFKFKCFCMNINKLEGRLKPFIAPSETNTLRTDDLKSNQAGLGAVHISSVRKILSAKARLQGEKHSKVEHLASIFNAAGAFLSQKIAA